MHALASACQSFIDQLGDDKPLSTGYIQPYKQQNVLPQHATRSDFNTM
jgi:hypothetical protein